MLVNTSVIYAKIPTEYPLPGEHLIVKRDDHFQPTLNDGDILLRNLCISLDPYMRGRMRSADIPSYVPAFELNKPLETRTVSEVIESKNPAFPVGSIVVGLADFSQYAVVRKDKVANLRILPNARDERIPLSAWVGVLGGPGLTSYASLKAIGKPKAGETIFISAAAGAVGQLVGQLAKLQGLRVIGSAGSDDKVAYLKTIGFDYAFNYKAAKTLDELHKAAPNGIDIYFENVGGETLDAVLTVMNTHGRIIACGMISQYNTTEKYGVKNLLQVITKRLTMQGFNQAEFAKDYFEDFQRDITDLLINKKIVYRVTEVKGIEAGPDALYGMLKHGSNTGKLVVHVADL
ncbi:hypothetical protein DFQ26_007908 [Actinomortierella ambigua]|nr:hypothetical protein DFQ26_007908 [Actinomortierella ambigua]